MAPHSLKVHKFVLEALDLCVVVAPGCMVVVVSFLEEEN
jgi:hypothetical protein